MKSTRMVEEIAVFEKGTGFTVNFKKFTGDSVEK